AIDELNCLVRDLQSDEIDVDQLSEKVKRASFLIKFCKGKLRDTDEEVKKVLEDMDVESIECATEEED
ncbi:MAG: exodeoxyribonuclease VII small subunit, partial [Sphingobacteriales bacterium]